MEDLHQQYEMHSVDIAEKLYTNKEIDTGWMGKLARDMLGAKNHTFHIGGCVTDFLDEIGSDIDFLLLDTTHRIPGEILDFLVLLPRLKENAVVCLHDMTTCQRLGQPGMFTLFCNIVLYNSVSADKIWNVMPDDSERQIPNIAAFRITNETRKNIMSVMGSLLIPWAYMPQPGDIDNYTKEIHSIYSDEERLLFDEAVNLNIVRYGLVANLFNIKKDDDFKIMILGAGERGRRFYSYLKNIGLDHIVSAWIDDAHGEDEKVDGKKLLKHEDIKDISSYQYAIITLNDRLAIAKERGYLYKLGMDDRHIITLRMW